MNGTITPATFRLPVNGMIGLLGKSTIGAAVAVTAPLPEPEAGDNAMEDVIVAAVHAGVSQLVGVGTTVRITEPPPRGNVTDEGLTVNKQAALCVTVTVLPATVAVPVRTALPSGLGMTDI